MFWSAAECALGQEAVPDPLQGQRVGAAGTTPVERVGGQLQELTGEDVVARMQRRELARQVKDVGVAGQAVEQDPPDGDGVLGCGPFPGRHTEKIGQNRHGSAAIPYDPLELASLLVGLPHNAESSAQFGRGDHAQLRASMHAALITAVPQPTPGRLGAFWHLFGTTLLPGSPCSGPH